MEDKIGSSEFFDIIESKGDIWLLNEAFKRSKNEFFDLVKSADDFEFVFDKIECRKKLEEYITKQLAVKVHQHELIEVTSKSIDFYQPFKGTRRRVNIEDDQLTEKPTLVNTKDTGRLLITGGNKGYRSSNKVYYVDECMNTLNKHSRMNFGRVGHAAVYINNKDIYVIGGYNADSNIWLGSMEVCYDAFNQAGIVGEDGKAPQPTWEMSVPMNEPRYYFGCCTWNNEFIFVFGGMNDQFMDMETKLSETQSKCLNSIERYSIETSRWEIIDLKTY